MLNKNEIATEYFRILNPIEHARTKEDAIKYKSEPYVIAADIYSHPNLMGRGGWTWYTGSASWYFVAGIKYILGLKKIGDYLEINPKIPQDWNNCHISLVLEDTTYLINIVRENKNSLEIKKYNDEGYRESLIEQNLIVYVDNEKNDSNKIKIKKDGKKHVIDVKSCN